MAVGGGEGGENGCQLGVGGCRLWGVGSGFDGGRVGSGEGDGFLAVGDAALVDEGFGLVDGERRGTFEVVGFIAPGDGVGEVIGFVF